MQVQPRAKAAKPAPGLLSDNTPDAVAPMATLEEQAAQARIEHDAELDELLAVERHVRLDNMSRDQLAGYAMRAYGVRLDPSDVKLDVAEQVRHLQRMRGV